MGITMPAIAATQQYQLLTFSCQVRQQRLVIFGKDLCSNRQLDDSCLSSSTGHVLAHTRAPVFGLDVLPVAKIDQGVETTSRNHRDIAATTAIAAIRPTELDILFAPERNAAIAAIAALQIDLGLIEKLHLIRRRLVAYPNEKGEWPAIPLNFMAVV